jgi:hypothetical protein
MITDEYIILKNGKTITQHELIAAMLPAVVSALSEQGYVITKPDAPITGPVVAPVDPVVTEPVKEPAKPDAVVLGDQTANLFEPFALHLPLQLFSEPVRSIDVSDLPPGLSYDAPAMKIYGRPTKEDSRIITVTAVTYDDIPRLLKATFRLAVTTGKSPEAPSKPDSATKPPVSGWRYPTTQR